MIDVCLWCPPLFFANWGHYLPTYWKHCPCKNRDNYIFNGIPSIVLSPIPRVDIASLFHSLSGRRDIKYTGFVTSLRAQKCNLHSGNSFYVLQCFVVSAWLGTEKRCRYSFWVLLLFRFRFRSSTILLSEIFYNRNMSSGSRTFEVPGTLLRWAPAQVKHCM